MNSPTKQKIAQTLREMMLRRSFDKITVKNLMDATGMKRQSFYYHFQDTRDVLLWICREELFGPISQSRLDFSEWMLYALHLLDKDRQFYRRVITAVQMDFLRELCDQAVSPRVSQLLYPEKARLDENQSFAVEFMTNGVADYFLRFVSSHQPLDLQVCRERFQFLVAQLKGLLH